LVTRVLLIGSGSIGRRYLGILRQTLPQVRVTALRRRNAPELDRAIVGEIDRVVDEMEAALDPRPDFAVIASPATTHIAFALALAEAGIPMLIEKPLSIDLDGCAELAARCSANAVPVVVGFTLRYHPGYLALAERLRGGAIGRPLLLRAEVGQYLPDWRPGVDYRHSVTARHDLGGGALLELSHELDLARDLLGMPRSVSAHLDRVGDLEIDVEDTVDLVMRHPIDEKHDVVASIHLDMLQRPIRRRFTVSGTDGTLELDLVTGRLHHARASGPGEEIHVASVSDRTALYADEIADLLRALRGGRPRVGLDDGIATQRIIDAVRRSDAAGCTVGIVEAA
jgi:predicted dehydrogenase